MQLRAKAHNHKGKKATHSKRKKVHPTTNAHAPTLLSKTPLTTHQKRHASRKTNFDADQNDDQAELEVLLNSVGADSSLAEGEYSIRPLTAADLENQPKNRNQQELTQISIDGLMGSTPRQNPFGYVKDGEATADATTKKAKPTKIKRPTKKQQENQQIDALGRAQYGDFVDMNDSGSGLVWAGQLETDVQSPESQQNADGEQEPKPLHVQILQLYLEKYEQQEDKELQANFDRQALEQQREQFVQMLVNTLSGKNYARFIHYFRICLQRMRTLLIRHQQAKQDLAKNIHLYVSVTKQQHILLKKFREDTEEVKIKFFRQASRLFGQDSDTFMPQLVIYLSSLTLVELEGARERRCTAAMNPYSCGFWTEEDATAFKEQFSEYLSANNIIFGGQYEGESVYDAENVKLKNLNSNDTHAVLNPNNVKRLIDSTFNVPMANKLYQNLDIHTDLTSPLLWSRLSRAHAKSHKVFVSNIPSTLTTRELMTLFGNCGVLNAAEIHRDTTVNNQTDVHGGDADADMDQGAAAQAHLTGEQLQLTAEQLHKQQQYDLSQGISMSKREALLHANAAALTVDIASLSLSHFTNSLKTDTLLVPSHVLDPKKLQKTITEYFRSQEILLTHEQQQDTPKLVSPELHRKLNEEEQSRLLYKNVPFAQFSDAEFEDPVSAIFTQQPGVNSQTMVNTAAMHQHFDQELGRFEAQHNKKMQRQKQKMSEALAQVDEMNQDRTTNLLGDDGEPLADENARLVSDDDVADLEKNSNKKTSEISPEELGLGSDIINADVVNSQLPSHELPGVNTPFHQGKVIKEKKEKVTKHQQQQELADHLHRTHASHHNNHAKEQPQSVTDQLLQFNFKVKTAQQSKLRDQFNVNEHHSPVSGFLYFATAEGKQRALKQSLQIFGVSTSSGYAMTTSDAMNKKQLIISNLHRGMTTADVSAFVRQTLGEHMNLQRADALAAGEGGDLAQNNTALQEAAATPQADLHSAFKTSIIERLYVPRSFNRLGGGLRKNIGSMGSESFFNSNRGYAIITFDNHDHAFQAFKHLNSATLYPEQFIQRPGFQHQLDSMYPTGDVQQIDAFNGDVLDSFQNQATDSSVNNGTNNGAVTYHQARQIKVGWRKEKLRQKKPPHPVTSFFPTFARPKSALYQQVNQQLKQAFDKNVTIEAAQ